MKIAPSVTLPFSRENGKSAAIPGHHGQGGQGATASAKPTQAGSEEHRTVPPGLERVQARLQALPARNAGQTNALDRINRNIARYTEIQALAQPQAAAPATPATPPTPTADTSAANPSDPATTVSDTAPPLAAAAPLATSAADATAPSTASA